MLMEIVGYAASILVGVSLGLIGSGGSILTIPILVYLMNIPPSVATSYSLFIVGVAALAGSIKGIKEKLFDLKVATYFGIPSLISIFIMRKFVVPFLPKILFTIFEFPFTKDLFIMLVFALLMIAASFSMIRKKIIITDDNKEINKNKIALKGVFVGLLTGFVGVGGGFLIIPTLVFAAKLPMKNAVATSLIIIAANALIGFAGSIDSTTIHWGFLLSFTALSVLGIFAGIYLSKKISNEKLKPAFGWFVLATGIYIVARETIFK